MSLDASYLTRRIEDIDTWWQRTHGVAESKAYAENWQRRDAGEVALQVAQHVRETVDLPALEQRLVSDVALDLEPLKEANAILKAADYDLALATGVRFEPAKRVESLEHLASLEPQKLDPLERAHLAEECGRLGRREGVRLLARVRARHGEVAERLRWVALELEMRRHRPAGALGEVGCRRRDVAARLRGDVAGPGSIQGRRHHDSVLAHYGPGGFVEPRIVTRRRGLRTGWASAGATS